MIPMKSKTIFTSRWWALLWAAGILWAAYDFVDMTKGPDDTDQNNAAGDAPASNMSDDAQISALSNMVNGLKAQ